jgi:hypothetical protein
MIVSSSSHEIGFLSALRFEFLGRIAARICDRVPLDAPKSLIRGDRTGTADCDADRPWRAPTRSQSVYLASSSYRRPTTGTRPTVKDTTVDRSRRLLYVCSSRAHQDLAVLVYASNPESAILSLKVSKLTDRPLTLNDLTSDPNGSSAVS